MVADLSDAASGEQLRPSKVGPNGSGAVRKQLRQGLLAGTALATTLLANIALYNPAHAQVAIFEISNQPITETNNNNCIFTGACIFAQTIINPNAPIRVTNNGNLLTLGVLGSTITLNTNTNNSLIRLRNYGDVTTFAVGAASINATTFGNNSRISVTNTGDIATFGAGSAGIFNFTNGNSSRINVTNSGGISTIGLGAIGLFNFSRGNNSRISVTNSGDINTKGINAYGIYGTTFGRNSNLTISNSGTIATRGFNADGISGVTIGRNADIVVTNAGQIDIRGGDAEGIILLTGGPSASIKASNSGDIKTTGLRAEGINAVTDGRNSDITITNDGDVVAKGALSDGILAFTSGRNSEITINSSGSIRAEGGSAYGITAVSIDKGSEITVNNSGELFGAAIGVYSYSATSTTINNTVGGDISAGSGLAIDTTGATSAINNAGLITGFVDLTWSDDTFTNMAGGEFNASGTSRFRRGNDLFLNEPGATLRTADNFFTSEDTRFTGLERFQNRGLITMVDGKQGDTFIISNTPGRTDLNFNGASSSELAVDTFLGGPGSRSDTLTIEGNTSGRTRLLVNNVNPGGGAFNREGIPVVFVDGNVNASNFFLDKPVDAGFFDYDLIFRPTGSGVFELKSHAGGGAHVLPRIVTATHEVFHSSTETWFDQTADLRALLARGSVCDDIAHPDERLRCQYLFDVTPAIWARGSGSWFEFDDNETTRANGRTYRYDLNRDLDIWQVESGIDFGKEGILSQDDLLVYGVLGGAVNASLHFDAVDRAFDLTNLEVGAYATYLRGGLFVDALFKAFFGEIDPLGAAEYSGSMDTQTYGLRVDSGYRFGGLQDGPFIEPLATLAVSWSHVDDFSHKGNSINFSDGEEVRGRVGVRTGTSMQIWEGTTLEPFVAGSFWGLLSGDHGATLTSTGTTFNFSDEPDDVWGEVSGGLNFFNPEAQTAVFAKVDYRFAEDANGISAKGGMRITW